MIMGLSLVFFRNIVLMAACASVVSVAVAAPARTQSAGEQEYFAIVDGAVISKDELGAYLMAEFRKRFYHGRPPEAEVKAFEKEVSENLIDRYLLLKEAQRRGMRPDEKVINEKISVLEKKYADDKKWQEQKNDILPDLRRQIGDDLLLEDLEKQVKNIPVPSEGEVKKFYDQNPQLFTTPDKDHVQMILLKVDPSSPSDVWQSTEEKAVSVLKQLRGGADFAEMARVHSGDDSAMNGGDMGFMHKGMLGQTAQQVLDLMAPGDISEPVLLLEGVGIFRLVSRDVARLNRFADVKERASGLLVRQRTEDSWDGLRKKLRSKAKIEVNEKVWESR